MSDTNLQMYPLVDPETGKHFYPQTHAKAVILSDGSSVEDHIDGHGRFAIATLSGNGYVLDIDFTFNEGKRIAVKFTAAPTVTEPYIVIGGTNYPIKKKNGNAAKITAGSYESLICGTNSFILLGEGGEYGTAKPTDVLAGKTLGTENGVVEGTIPIITGDSIETTKYNVESNYVYLGITPDAYYSGVNWVRKSEPNLIAANIKAGASIFGVSGNSNVVDTSAGTATAGQMLIGSKAYVDGALVTGTMTNNGSVTKTLGAGESFDIPAGYHDGTGKVTASTLSGQTGGTATAAQILEDETAWVGGVKLTGTMPNNGAVSATLSANGTYTIPAGYHDGTGKVIQSLTTKAAATITPGTTNQTIAAGTYLSGAQTIAGDADLVAANIKQDVGIFGVTGTYTSDGTLAANRVLSGYIGYSKGTKYTGSIASKAATTITPGTTNQTISSGVYLSGNITILGSSSLVSSNIKSGVTIFGVSGSESVVDTSDATATAANILEETTAYVDGELVEGSMVNNGAVAHSLGINGSYTVPAGYHDGTGKVTQSITTKAAATYTPTTSNQTISSGLYLSGVQTIKGDANLVSANIKAGVSIFGVSGNSNVVDTSAGTATAAQMLSGSKAYVDGALVTGTMTNRGAVSQTLNAGGSYTIPAGYHDGTGKVTANSLSSQTAGTAAAAEILKGKTAWVGGTKVTGTMANNGAVAPAALNAGGSYTIPAGYHNGSGKVTTNSLASQTSATATAAQILKGKTAWVGGTKLTGTMPNLSTYTTIDFATGNTTPVIPADTAFHTTCTDGVKRCCVRYSGMNATGTDDGTSVVEGYLTGNTLFGIEESTMAAAVGLTADKIVAGTSVMGVAGTYTSDGTLAANKMLSGVIGYSKGTKYTGSIASQAAKSITPGTRNQTVSSGVYLSGNITVLGSSNLVASNIKSGVKIFGVTGTLEVNEMKTYTKTFTKPKEDMLLSTGMDVDTIPRLYSVRMVIDGSTIYTSYVSGNEIISNGNGIYLELRPSVFLYVGDDAGNGNVGKISFTSSNYSRSTIVVTFYYF